MKRVLLSLGALLFPLSAHAAEIDLNRAIVVAPTNLAGPERKAVEMLVDEVQKRTRLRWEVAPTIAEGERPFILIGQSEPPNAVNHPAVKGPDGYRLFLERGPRPAIFVIGNDARGTLFGVGRLLREMSMSRDKVTVPDNLDIATAPKYPLRGHQLGYRPKTNSYDGWSLPMWEQYIRDLVVFGTNAVELIPPRSDDDADSPHFPLPPMEMMIGMSKLCADYGLDVWIWYPAMDSDYRNPNTVEFGFL